MGDAVTQAEVDAAHRQWRAQQDQVDEFANPNSARSRQNNPKHRGFMMESFQRHAEAARAHYQDLCERFDRQERVARELREEDLLRRRVEAEEETARQLARQTALAGRTTEPGGRTMNEKLQNTLQKKEADRFRLLQTLYEVTDGNEHAMAEMAPLYEHAGITLDEGEAAYRYLQREGLVLGKPGHHLSITHHGVVEMENALRHPDRDTDHFQVPVINMVNNLQGATIGAFQTGADASATFQQQNNAAPSPELARLFTELRAKTADLPADEQTDTAELVNDLEEQSKREKPNAKKVKATAASLEAIKVLGPTIATIVGHILATQP